MSTFADMELTPAGLRQALARASERQTHEAGTIVGDDGATGNELVPAAVLVGIVDRTPGPTVLLTRRTDHLRDHAGQISFPGGRIETADTDPIAAALRESEEEIGLRRNEIEILGSLDDYWTVTGFHIHPVVGWVAPSITPRPDPFEVAEVFEVPLSFVLDPANHQRRSRMYGGVERHYYVLPFGQRFIWGATAGMLVNLARLLRG